MTAHVVARLLDADKARLATEIQRRIGVRATRDEPLARLTTMRVGGPADVFAVAHNLFELRALVRLARSRDVPLFLLGRGSDLVVSDAGIAGLVVQVRAEGHRIDGTRLIAEPGLAMARLATVARDAALGGAEFALAIPGTIGGAVWANAGAHGSDMRSVLVEAAILPADGGAETSLDADGLGLAYRTSRLKRDPGAFPDVVISVTLGLQADSQEAIAGRLDEIRRWRRANQPLGLPSAGSVFRNPADASPAGAMIDGLGLKGLREGGAAVSERHANFIVNDRGATAADVRRLAERVRSAVREASGVELEYEIAFAGDWSGWPGESAA